MKICTLCKTTPIEKGSWCKQCTKEYNSKYRKMHRKKLQQLNKRWREDNSERNRETKYTYYKSSTGRVTELLHAANRRAKDKQIPIDITKEFITNLWAKQNNKCSLTHIEFQIPQERTGGKASPYAPSIDRIDSNKGYTKDNVRLVCVAVNYALNEFGEEIFEKICRAYIVAISNPKLC